MLRVLGICALTLCSAQSLAEDWWVEKSEAYVMATLSKQSFYDTDNTNAGALFGMKDIYPNGWLVAGELEVRFPSGDELEQATGFNQNYSFDVNVPLGRRFTLSDSINLDAYGLIGYSTSRLERVEEVEDLATRFTINGVKWGLGSDLNISDWVVGVRYAIANLDGSKDDNLTLSIGTRF